MPCPLLAQVDFYADCKWAIRPGSAGGKLPQRLYLIIGDSASKRRQGGTIAIALEFVQQFVDFAE